MDNLKRDTNADLMNSVFRIVNENGCYEKAESIMDYFLAESYHLKELTNYRFNFLVKVNFGGSEGIYLDCYIEGDFDENSGGRSVCLSCGTFKTLHDDLEAMRIMGDLAGSLTYFAHTYINKEIDRYSPVAEMVKINRKDGD